MNNIWKQLKTLRTEAGLTQKELAARSGNSRQEINMMENGRFHGGVDKVCKAFDYLGYSLEPKAILDASVTQLQQSSLPDSPIRILAIDDDADVLRGYQQTFEPSDFQGGANVLLQLLQRPNQGEGVATFQVDTATSGEEGVEKVRHATLTQTPYSLLFLDMRMPGGWDGLRTAQEVHKIDPDVRIILLSAYRDYTLEKMREEMGENFVIHQKPYLQEELLQLTTFVAKEWYEAKQLQH